MELTRDKIKTKEQARIYAIQRADEAIQEVKRILRERENGKDLEEIEAREPLAIEKRRRLIIELSTGGDADGFILDFDESGELIEGAYYWADWGQYEEIPLRYKEAEEVIDAYLGGDASAWLG